MDRIVKTMVEEHVEDVDSSDETYEENVDDPSSSCCLTSSSHLVFL